MHWAHSVVMFAFFHPPVLSTQRAEHTQAAAPQHWTELLILHAKVYWRHSAWNVLIRPVGFLFLYLPIEKNNETLPNRAAKSNEGRFEIIGMFTESPIPALHAISPPTSHANATERQTLLIWTPNGAFGGCCLPPWERVARCYSAGMRCDVICIQGKAPVWPAQNGIQVFHIGIDPFRADGESRETGARKWVYLGLFADQKNLVQDANGRDLSVWIKPARQLCYWAFTGLKFKEISNLRIFFYELVQLCIYFQACFDSFFFQQGCNW